MCVCLYISRARLAWGSHNRKIASRSGGRTAGVDEAMDKWKGRGGKSQRREKKKSQKIRD